MADNQIKVASCQLLTSEDVSASTVKVLQQIEACAEMGIQIAAFPEGCLFGYCCRTDYWEHISPQVFKEAEARIAEAARRHAMAVVVGSRAPRWRALAQRFSDFRSTGKPQIPLRQDFPCWREMVYQQSRQTTDCAACRC